MDNFKITRFFILVGYITLLSLVCVTSGHAYAATSPDCSGGTIENATPQADGAEWESDEYLGTDGGITFLLTWDLFDFYVAFIGVNTETDNCYVAFDLNPSDSTGATATIGGAYFSGVNLPDRAFCIDSSSDVTFYTASGSNWDAGTNKTSSYTFYAGNTGNTNTEVQLPRADVGIPMLDRFNDFAIWFWVNNNAESSVSATWPSENPTGAAAQLGHCLSFAHSNTDVSVVNNGIILIEDIVQFIVLLLISIPIITLIVIRRKKSTKISN